MKAVPHISTLSLSLVVFALLAVGCGSEPPPPAEKSTTVFDDQLKALEKAKAVEQQQLEAAKAQQAQIDAMTSGEATTETAPSE